MEGRQRPFALEGAERLGDAGQGEGGVVVVQAEEGQGRNDEAVEEAVRLHLGYLT